ncbi:WD40 repeat domain-containing protein [Nostoc sp.]
MAFSPDNQIIASGSEDKTAKLWDVKTGECLMTFSAQNSLVRANAFSSDGEIFALAVATILLICVIYVHLRAKRFYKDISAM